MKVTLCFCSIYISLWTAVVTQDIIAANDTLDSDQEYSSEESSDYTWSEWSGWTPCSKTCGGGVSVQTRDCITRSTEKGTKTLRKGDLEITLQSLSGSEDCVGPSSRHHECNTNPCSGATTVDSRAEQCSSFDRRPFRGKFYNWVPYVDGDAPCTLNCRPVGQHFYASLARALDGTPCTKPGFRAICVQGTCKAVGREAVLSSSASREVRCGRRLVSGLFTRPRLPLGYSYVATVPRGACRLNVSEIMPSENYIALKVTNGSYIVNGEFAVSAVGSYDAVGARFLYARNSGLDTIFAYGPLQQPIDIMILYTQPNPNIKYEYLTEYLPGEIGTDSAENEKDLPETLPTVVNKHMRRHHNLKEHFKDAIDIRNPNLVGGSIEDGSFADSAEDDSGKAKSFIWKIISYTQCSRSCGGGFQVGKFKCVDKNGNNREVSPGNCAGSPPPSRRRRCGTGPCIPRWRAAAWSPCPQCGPATRTRIVGCVQDHSKGIIKVSDHKCPTPKLPTTEVCDIADCATTLTEYKHVSIKETAKPKDRIESFHEGPVYTVNVNGDDADIGPEYSFSAAGGWLYTDWSECVGWCVGGGVQSRGTKCTDPAGCPTSRAPETSRSCSTKITCDPYDGQWFTGEWSVCSSSCNGRQVRGVLCIGGSGRHLKDNACKAPRPDHEQECGDDCSPMWYFSDWSQCKGSCEQSPGIQRRTVWCARDDVAASDTECASLKPPAQRVCKIEGCLAAGTTTSSPEVNSESQRIVRNEINPIQEVSTPGTVGKGCVDKLTNCALAVQARLCHYNYYMKNCCHSCGR